MHKDITELYCFIDDFCKIYEKHEKKKFLSSNKQRNRGSRIGLSEMLTIMLMFHTSYFKNFKYFYKSYVGYFHKEDFPKALSYNRFVELIPRLFLPLSILQHCLLCDQSGTYFIDATTISAGQSH